MLLKGGIIIDGTGRDRFVSDIRIRDDKIEEIGNLNPKNGEEVIKIPGFYIAPGFVDILNHSDAFVTLFENPAQESLLRQGVTTILMGNCGSSLAPLQDAVFINSIQKWGDVSKINVNWLTVKEYLDELKKHKFGLNLATLVGHSTIRRGFSGDEPRALSDEELRQMEYMIEEGLQDGAFGVSLGLGYTHGRSATKEELESVARITRKHTALLSVHLRNDAKEFEKAVDEVLEIVQKTKINTQISHFKVSGKEFSKDYEKALEKIKKIHNVNFDIYPYHLSAVVLYAFLPKWATKKGNDSLFEAIKNTSNKQKLIQDMKKDPYSYKDMQIAMGRINPIYFGKTMGEIAKKQEISAEEVALNFILTSHNRIIVFSKTLDEKSLIKALRHPGSIVSSDGVGYKTSYSNKGEFVHPRYFGTFAKLLGEYSREKNVLSLEEAINKITMAPAQKIRLEKRGKIAKNFYADLVIFDYNSINEKSEFSNPYQYPQGIEYVFVNGQIAVKKGELKNLAGQILTKN